MGILGPAGYMTGARSLFGPLGQGRGTVQLGPAQAITLDNTGNGALANYIVPLFMTSRRFDFSQLDARGENLRFLDSDQATILAHYTESFSKAAGTATVLLFFPSIPANSSYTIYYQPDVSGAPDTSQLFGTLSDGFGSTTGPEEYCILGDLQTPSVYGEHGIIANGYFYGTDLATKATKFDPISGALIWSVTIGNYCPTAPAIDSHGKLHYYSSAGMYRVRDDGATATIEQTYTTGFTGSSNTMPDYECTVYDADNDRVFFFDTSGHLVALNTVDYSVAWTNTTVNGNNAGGYSEQSSMLIAPDGNGVKWLWFYDCNIAKLWQIKLADGTVNNSVTLAHNYTGGRYTGPLYAADRGKLYIPSPGGGGYVYEVDPTTLAVTSGWPLGPFGPDAGWYIWRPMTYRAGVLCFGIAKDFAAPGGGTASKYVAVDVANKVQKWLNNDQLTTGSGNSCIIQSLIAGNVGNGGIVFCSSHNYGPDAVGSPDVYLWGFNVADGTQAFAPIRLRTGTASCVPFAVGRGRIGIGEWFSRGYQIIKVTAGGADAVNVPWKGDTYRTGDVTPYFSGALAGSAGNGGTVDGTKWTQANSGQIDLQGQSLMIRGNNTPNWAGLVSLATFARSGFAVRTLCRWNFNTAGNPSFSLQFTDTLGNVHPVIASIVNAKGQLQYDQAGTPTTLADGAIALDGWHTAELKAGYPNDLHWEIDGDFLTILHPGAWSTTYDNQKLGLATNYPADKADAELKYVIVRPYSEPEPAFFVAGRDRFGGSAVALTSHPPLAGTAWTSLSGSWATDGNGNAVNTGSGWCAAVLQSAPATADVQISLDVLYPNSTDFAAGICFRATDANNKWQWAVHRDVPGAILFEWVAGSPVERGRVGSGTSLVVPGSKLRLGVVCSGSVITCYLLGQKVIYSNPAMSGQAATKHGITEFRDGSSFTLQNKFSNFIARAA